MKIINYFIVIACCSIILDVKLQAQNTSLGSYIFSAGYEYMSSSASSLEFIAGQSAVGVVVSEANVAEVGFLHSTKQAAAVKYIKTDGSILLHLISPNPLKDEGRLNFELGKVLNVRLQVINVLGEIVSSFDFGYLHQGQHSRLLYFDRLFDGFYYYRIYGGNIFSVGSFMVLR